MLAALKSGETVKTQTGQHRRKPSLAAFLLMLVLGTSNAQAVSQTIISPRAPDAKAMMCAGLHGNMQKQMIKNFCDNKRGNREDLEDVIYSISPTETPFFTMASRVEATAVLHEWQTDALTDAATNAQIEGDDAANGTSTPTSRLGMYCQIASKYAVVSDTQQAVDKAGRASEMSYQVAKRLGELKRNYHCALAA